MSSFLYRGLANIWIVARTIVHASEVYFYRGTDFKSELFKLNTVVSYPCIVPLSAEKQVDYWTNLDNLFPGCLFFVGVGGFSGGGLAALFDVFHSLFYSSFFGNHLADRIRIGFKNIGVGGFLQKDQFPDALGAEIGQTGHKFNKCLFNIFAGFDVVIEFINYCISSRVFFDCIRINGFIGGESDVTTDTETRLRTLRLFFS